MYNLRLGISLFSASSVLCTFLWFATAPELSLGQPSLVTPPSGSTEAIDTTFIKQIKASLNEGVSEPPVEGQVRPINVSYDGSYGVNEEYLRRICNETTQR